MPRMTNKSSAVRQQKAKKDQPADTPERRLFRILNYFPSPPWAGRAGAELVKAIDPEAKAIWECACGEGHMAEPLKEYFPRVYASDIHPHGYGQVMDYLGFNTDHPEADWIITNPPFDKAAEFIRLGLHRARRGVAMLLRIAFLEGASRHSLLYEGPHPLTICAVFSERVSMCLGQWDPEADLASCNAWFIFDKLAPPGAPRIISIPPGTQERLTRPDDVRRFAKPAPAPLLDYAGA